MSFQTRQNWTHMDQMVPIGIQHAPLPSPLRKRGMKANEDINLLLIPNFFINRQSSNSVPISIMVCNCQDATSRLFLNTLAELLRCYDPAILALVETKVSGSSAKSVCRKLNFDSLYKVDAQGFLENKDC